MTKSLHYYIYDLPNTKYVTYAIITCKYIVCVNGKQLTKWAILEII